MHAKEKQRMDYLSAEIIKLKKILELSYNEKQQLTQEQMLVISRLLDNKINQFMKLQQGTLEHKFSPYRV